ncbi:hypothetical protein BC833DRAFT_582694 [Globomyces pollinis-pini]|nr:hypothetical protein BC833DRAFT_582694 [Globomyces pollinis-pini]
MDRSVIYASPDSSTTYSPKLPLEWKFDKENDATLINNVHVNLTQASITFNKSKRKMKIPHRAICPPVDQVDRSFQKIITLDVYTVFKENPSQLLNRKLSVDENSDSDISIETLDSPTSSQSPKETKKSSSQTSRISRPDLPDFITRKEPLNLDLDPFKDTRGAPGVSWKAGSQPLPITRDMPDFKSLTSEEVKTCGVLRISPQQYMEIKRTMLTAVQCYGPFKKREAQTWFRIDVNKICIIYDWFKSLKWIPNTEDWAVPDQTRRNSVDQPRTKKVKRR